MEIPLTLLDIQRVAELRGVDEREIFRDFVQERISERSSLFMIKKDHNGACIFLTSMKKCAIHTAKPNACRFYNCSLDAGEDLMPWTATCIDPSQRIKLWEQSVASMVTKAYIRNNGSAWNRTDYDKAIKTIYNNIVTDKNQRIKLAREIHGEVLAMIYDCSTCEKRGLCSEETPITLDDVRRISSYLGISRKAFFSKNIMDEPSVRTGCLRLIRDGNCVFFDQERHCTIEEVRPMHCRFRPCPMKTQTSEEMDALFLGSGTVEEQFRHQVAMSITREYVIDFGTSYRKKMIDTCLNKIDKISVDSSELKKFCSRIASFRYVDDTLTY
jgi:Fe-S-cluster containining protein